MNKTQTKKPQLFSIGKMLSKAMELYTKNFRDILYITLIIYLPINIIISFAWVYLTTYDDWLRDFHTNFRLIQILESIFGILSTMAIAYLIKMKLSNQAIDYNLALKKAISRWGAAIRTNIMAGFFLFGLFILLIIPGIIYCIYWIFIPLVIVLNDLSGQKALNYSKQIVKGRWWTVFGYLFVFGLLAFGAALLSSFVLEMILISLPEYITQSILYSIVSDTFLDVFIAYFIVVGTIFYLNFEVTAKKEVETT